jgi:hypothetical protein
VWKSDWLMQARMHHVAHGCPNTSHRVVNVESNKLSRRGAQSCTREREREREREKSMRNVTISANEKWMNHLDRPL